MNIEQKLEPTFANSQRHNEVMYSAVYFLRGLEAILGLLKSFYGIELEKNVKDPL
jgi:hypothetical protein